MNVSLPRALRTFVDDQVRSGRYSDAGEVIRESVRLMEAHALAQVGALADGDTMTVAMLTMMEAAKSAREDLKAITDGVKALNSAKQAWRELSLKVRRDLAANDRLSGGRALDFSRGRSTERAYHRARVPRLDPSCPGGVCFEIEDLYPARIVGVEDLRAIVSIIQSKIDSLSDMGEMESLRLQMAMDRRSKMMSTLSNLLKKISETSAGIAANIK